MTPWGFLINVKDALRDAFTDIYVLMIENPCRDLLERRRGRV